MAAPDPQLLVTGNSFFDSLPAGTRVQLASLISLKTMKRGDILSEPGETFRYVVFPISSVISTVTLTEEGAAVEVGLAGHEGLSPLPMTFGSLTSRHSTIVQLAGSAYRMDAGAFLAIYHADLALIEHCRRYAEYSFAAATQFAACNSVHPSQERCARWMLMANDRVGTAEFTLTHEYLAQMLGVRRATVTEIALGLNKAGLITYRRGQISVIDRDGLEESACECYAVVNSEIVRLMGYGARRGDVRELTG